MTGCGARRTSFCNHGLRISRPSNLSNMISSSTTPSNEGLDDAQPSRDPWVLGLLLAFPSTGFIQKYTGLTGVVAYVAVVLGLVFLTLRLTTRFEPWLSRHFRNLAVLSVAGLAMCFVMLHPIEDGRGHGKSSDRDEGLEIAVTRMVHGQTPYYPSNKIAGPLSVMPGSILLATPFVALGNSGYQNVFWLAVFLLAASRFFRDKAAALWLLTAPMLVSTAALYEFVSGGDLIANGAFVAVLFLFALKSWDAPAAPGWQRWLACILLGVGLASRANFLLLVPLFGAAIWRLAGVKNATLATSLTVLTSAAIILPFYLNDPAGFTPLRSGNKLAFADHSLPWASTMMIGATVFIALACALWLLRKRSRDPMRGFFRCCTLITLTPMVCAVLVSTWISVHPDFSIMRDRFGLMYVFFALLGWGGSVYADKTRV